MKIIVGLFAAAALAFSGEPDWAKLDAYAVDLLQRYIRIDTSNPPANTASAAALLKGELEKHGFTVQLYDLGNGRVNLLTRLPGRDRSKKPLLLMNHMDVVPVDRSAWSVDPFAAIIKDGYLWGRGALDMKGIGVEQVVALIALKEAGIVPARDIVMFSNCDEEMGGTNGIKWMVKNHPQEIDAEYAIDEGGVISRDVLAPGKFVAGIAVGEKQMLWLRVRAKGTAGHGSQPIPDNANIILGRAIARALDLTPAARENPVVAEMHKRLGTFADNKFTNALRSNTISLTTLRSGVGSPAKINVIPSTAEGTLDCRLLPGVNADEFVSEMKARMNDPRITVETLSDPVDAGSSKVDTPLLAAIASAIEKHDAGVVVTPMLIPYGTDSVVLRKRGVTAYGLNPITVDAPALASMHSDEERVPIAEFTKGIRIFFDVLRSDF